MKKNIPFELLILAIIMFPFAYIYINWQPKFSLNHQNKFYYYLYAVVFFYIVPLLMQFLDSRKPNAELLLKSAKRIRLIWSAYLSALGLILFYYLLNDYEYDKPRLLGVALSLFLFASGNFRQNIHPTSIFAGNGIFSNKASLQAAEERNNRKNQRFMAKLFFWVGIVGTVFFLYFKESTLTSWGLIFVGMVIFYGIAIRLIRGVV
ncbi:hypothetical protein GCM10011514_22540 [Emticicia aquatilis]|uniref:Uncharacterized protein n=1 Tax=Emticicia aquatilis TaxID=1537369 RepID=A0A916YRT7_9BACT|nr:hypothetical protein [Emticicia aquatilis]GGD57917.1 hypothetical protein GCM10011514_22540 [Emticicia aquatilis]